MTVLQRQCMIIVTLLSTLLLLKVWPRFSDDAMSVAWYVYLVLIAAFAVPLLRKTEA
ncbi:MAG: hypothetical protein HN849_12210 [Victivallales bacterium]|nr:hypothetical protein [Victivallales bacterium]